MLHCASAYCLVNADLLSNNCRVNIFFNVFPFNRYLCKPTYTNGRNPVYFITHKMIYFYGILRHQKSITIGRYNSSFAWRIINVYVTLIETCWKEAAVSCCIIWIEKFSWQTQFHYSYFHAIFLTGATSDNTVSLSSTKYFK